MESYFCYIKKEWIKDFDQLKSGLLNIPGIIFEIDESDAFLIQISKSVVSNVIFLLQQNFNNTKPWCEIVSINSVYIIFEKEVHNLDINISEKNSAWQKMKSLEKDIEKYKYFSEMVYNTVYRRFLITSKLAEEINFLKETIGSNLIGIYPFGSIVLDYFDPKSSDYDVLVITKDEIELSLKDELMKHFSQKKELINKIELCIATKKTIYEYIPTDLFWYKSSVCDFSNINLGKDWIVNRFILLKGNFSFYGKDISLFIKQVSSEELVRIEKEFLLENWSKYKNGADWMSKKKYQSFTILTMARILYTIENGDCVSKRASGEWCANFYKETANIINWATGHDTDEDEGDQNMCCEMINFALNKV